MPSLAAGLAAERRRKNAKHARRLEKKLGVKVAGSEERRLSGVFGHSVSVLSTAPIMIGIVMTIFTLLFFFCFGRWLWRRSRE